MEKKLTLEHLAPYLPYGLNMLNDFGDVWKINMAAFDPNFKKITTSSLPILRSLSDLTKEIDHKGHDVIPVDYISTSTQDGQRTMRRIANEQEMDVLDYWKVQRLCEMHFDVFGLIDAGLAIDINTLEK